MNLTLRVANYMSRYAPSQSKITSYLEKKKYSGNIPDFLREIGYSEDMMLDMWIRSFIATGKGEREIMVKLLKKWFPKEKILEKVEVAQEDIRDWENQGRNIEIQIQNLLTKWKSKMIISVILWGKYPYFRDQIREILDTSSDISWLEKEVQKYRQKYNLSDRAEQKKFYDAIIRKGFKYGEIRDLMEKE